MLEFLKTRISSYLKNIITIRDRIDAAIKVALLALVLSCIGFISDAVSADRPIGYIQTESMYNHFHGKYDIVMFGDSLTERGHWQDMFPDKRIGNRGIGGDDTQGMIDRISAVEATGANKVFIMAGTNDLSRKVQPDVIARNIITIAKHLSARGISPVIQSTVLSGKERIGKNPRTAQINELLKLNAQANGFIYIDINRFLSPDGYLPDDFTVDGTHLTVQGYEAWQKAISRYL